MFGLGEGDSLVIINDFEGNLVRFEETLRGKDVHVS